MLFILIDKEELQENPKKMKQFVLSLIDKMPREALDVVEKTSLSNISYSQLKIRLPWNILFGNIVKENVCVVGDALHPMTPDINQGGCSALEDAIVLGRCLGEFFLKKSGKKDDEFERIEKCLVKYGRERRWRSDSLVTVAYCVGFIQQSKGKMMSFFRKIWLSKYTSNTLLNMATYDCGDLVF